ncbi:enoyl-CoA hydratase/isomerase family protein [Brevibacillus sp. SYSU BS000544]|uniref:enoyl-CoA hydratase/isomerase family protein n=1 Tax=Brevibacillus sp. SYSU BS000544 TaxID=3416443 RepID=UPI003CE5581C
MGAYIQVEKSEGIATVTINNPPLNVLSSYVLRELDEAFAELAQDQEVTVVLFTGAGNKAFIAGADIKEFPQLIHNDNRKEYVMNLHQVFRRIEQFPKPTIALLNGMTLGGGCEVALTFDMRVAEEHVRIGLPEVNLGIFPGGGGTQRLPRLIGTSKAKEMMFTGEPVSAETAERIGLVNQVVASGEGLFAARELAKKIAKYSLQSLSRIKQAVSLGMERGLDEAIDLEADLFCEVFSTEDNKEGIQAFIEKRAPHFTNR